VDEQARAEHLPDGDDVARQYVPRASQTQSDREADDRQPE
jgi:hypothetical protein